MLNGRTYVVNSVDLVNAVQKNPKSLVFNTIIVPAAQRFTGASDDAMKIVRQNINGEEGNHGFFLETGRGMHANLAPGSKELDAMNRAMFKEICDSLDSLDSEQGKIIDLYAWARHAITLASSNAAYGPMNPFAKYPELEKMFWYLCATT
jgi:hypothetical protein